MVGCRLVAKEKNLKGIAGTIQSAHGDVAFQSPAMVELR